MQSRETLKDSIKTVLIRNSAVVSYHRFKPFFHSPDPKGIYRNKLIIRSKRSFATKLHREASNFPLVIPSIKGLGSGINIEAWDQRKEMAERGTCSLELGRETRTRPSLITSKKDPFVTWISFSAISGPLMHSYLAPRLYEVLTNWTRKQKTVQVR